MVSPGCTRGGYCLQKAARCIRAVVFASVLLSSQANAGLLFSRSGDGHFKFTTAKADPWFYYDHNEYLIQSPDKWQHFMGNYILYRPTEKIVGRWKAIALFTSLDVIKEIGDGYREGVSVRDLTSDFLGILAALTDQRLVCTYDDNTVVLKYHFKFPTIK